MNSVYRYISISVGQMIRASEVRNPKIGYCLID